jgi:protein-disulfide isomerase
VEFADYQCPYCARHAADTFPGIKSDMIGKGKLSYVFVNFPLENVHANAFRAAEGAECAGKQDKFWEMHHQLFRNQSRLNEQELSRLAADLGLDIPKFQKCLSGETTDMIRADMAEGRRLGVAGTPAFFIGTRASDGSVALVKRISGAVPLDVLRQAIDEVTKDKSQRSWHYWPWAS